MHADAEYIKLSQMIQVNELLLLLLNGQRLSIVAVVTLHVKVNITHSAGQYLTKMLNIHCTMRHGMVKKSNRYRNKAFSIARKKKYRLLRLAKNYIFTSKIDFNHINKATNKYAQKKTFPTKQVRFKCSQ